MRKKLNLLTVISLVFIALTSFNHVWVAEKNPGNSIDGSRIETFTFNSNGTEKEGKIYLPETYRANNNLPAIFLVDYTEQHFKLATDEFEQVVKGTKKAPDFDAIVVSLANIPDIDAEPETYQEQYEVFKNMAIYVEANFTKNKRRIFIGKGSEGGIVLMTLFAEQAQHALFDHFIVTDPSPKYASAVIELIENNNFPQNKSQKRLHFSFSTSNDREKCLKLIQTINEAKSDWLQFESVEYTTSNYENTYPISFAEGIKFIAQP